ncbi:proline-rich proteoglycan 2-like [Durio zibethinus]|uniref:Proline-rich proteoglycan 2-like n=1 Tax=Durio zibethinus TaxID=66656 RepID=A0A6P5Z5I6_DURZI|nr:proline-rich proteoglycan 2-like [Durio zibethinus]
MNYSPPQGSPSQDGYPQSGKPVGGYDGEGPPRGKSHHQKQQRQQQASPVRVLPQGHILPQNNNPQSIQLGVSSSLGYPHNQHSSLPGSQSSHNQPHQQQPAPGVLSHGYHPKDNHHSRDNRHSRNQFHKQETSIQDPSRSESSSKTQQELIPSKGSVENHMDPPKNPTPTASDLPDHGEKHLLQTNDEPTQQPKSADHNNGYQQKPHRQPQPPEGAASSREPLPVPEGYPPTQQPMSADQTNGYQQKPHRQPQPPEGAASSRVPLPVPEGYPPPRPPTSPSKLEPRRKKGLLEKIFFCCF